MPKPSGSCSDFRARKRDQSCRLAAKESKINATVNILRYEFTKTEVGKSNKLWSLEGFFSSGLYAGSRSFEAKAL